MTFQNYHSETLVIEEADDLSKGTTAIATDSQNRELKIVWRNVLIFILLHIAAVYGFYLFFTKAMWATRVITLIGIYLLGTGITMGAHRLWAHKSFKARLPLRIILVIAQTFCIQNSVIEWVRDHRMHHKYSETDADPHNAKRGFFFSHIGWLLVRKHPEIKAKGHTVDVSDLWADPLLRFQHKYYLLLSPLIGIVLPSYIPTLWGETLWTSFFVNGVLRYVYTLNSTWLVNSVAHMWGTKPYDKNMGPVESNLVYLATIGEGFHNYHHVYPWDYRAAELGNHSFNITKKLIDGMAKIGWAYDLRTVSPDIIEKRVKRTGDGSHNVWGVNTTNNNELKVNKDCKYFNKIC